MAKVFKEGDRVEVIDREATADDIKSGLFYNHYRGIVGSVQKVFETTEDVAITVDDDSLTEPIAARHSDVRESMKNKWLDGLSEEGRRRLSPEERNFILRYTILIAPADLKPSSKPIPESSPDKAHTETPVASETAAGSASSSGQNNPKRKTAAEIEAHEDAYLAGRSLNTETEE